MCLQIKQLILILFLCSSVIKCFDREIVCDKTGFDNCAYNVISMGYPNVTVQWTKEIIENYCRELPMNIKCMKDHTKRCLQSFARLAASLMVNGVSDFFKNLCASKHTHYFYRIGSYSYYSGSNTHKRNGYNEKLYFLLECVHSAKDNLGKCSHNLVYSFTQISFLNISKVKFPLMCCHYWIAKDCIVDAITDASRKTGICTKEHVIEYVSVNQAMNDNFIKWCGVYIHGTESCNHIVLSHKLYKTGAYKLTKTILPPLIDILQSF